MNTVLTILCACMVLLIMICVFMAGALAATLFRSRKTEIKEEDEKQDPPDPLAGATEIERRRIKEEQEQQEAQLKAFQQMMDYNPDIAYGLGKSSDLSDK